MMTYKTEYQKAIQILDTTDLSTSEKVAVVMNLSCQKQDDYPFVKPMFNKGEISYYTSTKEEIQSFGFSSEQEVILANALVETLGENFNKNDFTWQLKAVFRLLGIENDWTK